MGYLERARELMAQAGPDFVHHRKRDDANALVRGFMAQRTDLTTTLYHLRSVDLPSSYLSLPSPGPLYGFLRKLGVTQPEAARITTEERSHYAVATKAKLTSRILIKFSTSDSGETQIHVYFSYTLPPDIDSDRARELIRTISLPPVSPSPDDLAKLP